jgi:hypothetical protein
MASTLAGKVLAFIRLRGAYGATDEGRRRRTCAGRTATEWVGVEHLGSATP